MQPHQIHYRSKQRAKGWLNDADEYVWPEDEKARRDMARGLFGLQLVGNVDYWVMLSLDDLEDTCDAPWADRQRLDAKRIARRAVLATLSEEQKAAVADLLSFQARGLLHSFCSGIEQSGLRITRPDPMGQAGAELQIQPGDHLDLHQDMYGWLEDFSMVYGRADEGQAQAEDASKPKTSG